MQLLKFSNQDIFPSIGLGTWLSKQEEVYQAVTEAIKTGYRHIDCAYIYKNESEVGQALTDAFNSGLVKREEMFITSKLWNSDHHPERVENAIKQTLHDLKLDYLDLYLMHWPIAFQPGTEQAKTKDDLADLNEIPLEITWKAMNELKLKGLTKHIGVSNFNISKIENLIRKTGIKPENNQVEIHPYFQQNEMLSYCNENEILLTAYAPLGSRHLINSESAINNHPVIKQIAKTHNCTETQIMLAWNISRNICVIPKSVHKNRIIDNYQSINLRLSKNEICEINLLDQNLRQSRGLYAVLPDGFYTYENIWNE